ncbi:NADH-quinone oxidoreductase subunit C, partial [Micromonospora sp. DH15]|nr:NADH-quinone oxidoreductase subunit C [Micromonospora sp. DH15]
MRPAARPAEPASGPPRGTGVGHRISGMTPEEVGQRLVALLAPVEATASVSGGQAYARATVDVPPASWRDAD